MLGALHPCPEHRTESLKFGAAEACAGGRRRTDRAMVLDKDEGAVLGLPAIGHITFPRADGGELPDAEGEIGSGIDFVDQLDVILR